MSMLKVVSPNTLSSDEPIVQLVKQSSRGLIGKDRQDFEKRASTSLLKEIDKVKEKIASDETLIHILALGATEDYGCNRNGDGFRRAVCKDYHDTFRKHAKFYRNHKNKDPKKSYGYVVKSAWHSPMKRIELLVALNNTKQAAERNKGLIADRELEKIASDKDIFVSMACAIPYDVCSYCGKKSTTTKDYCTGTRQGGMCKAGGLRDNIGSLVEVDGGIHQLHADNPNPTFFDISHVIRPADRIAHVTGALTKSASCTFQKGADMAKEYKIVIPYEVVKTANMSAYADRLLKLAYTLSDREDIIYDYFNNAVKFAPIFDKDVQHTDEPLDVPKGARKKFASVLHSLANKKISLPLIKFIELTTNNSIEKSAEIAGVVNPVLPGIYTRMLQNGDILTKISKSRYNVTNENISTNYDVWASKLAENFSVAPQHVNKRMVKSALYGKDATEIVKKEDNYQVHGQSNEAITGLAEEYALYKLSFLDSLNQSHDPNSTLTTDLVLLQNYVI